MKRTFVIGDIHGCYDELMKLLDLVGLSSEDTLISVGDIVDRGPKSPQVFDFLSRRPNTIVLMGNHERKHLRNVLSYSQEIVKLQMEERYEDFLKWISALPYYYEHNDAIIVHAGFENSKSINAQREDVLCGSTSGEKYLEGIYPGKYWTDHYFGIKPVIFGHHVTGDEPEIKNNTWGIDTGCCHGGYLTAVELPGFKIHRAKAEKDYWKEELVKWQIPILETKDWMNMSLTAAKKELGKLRHVDDPRTRCYLDELENILRKDETLLPLIKQKLDEIIEDFHQKHKQNFAEMALQHPLKNVLFKSRNGQIKMDYLESSLNSRSKILEMAGKIGLIKL